jgi:hypothetical protein|tara:strand:- start:1089 stop:1385 length:297 start_codon:yes stop_codon:yes gene_type:complete
MRSPEQRMFLNVITQAIHDAAYKGNDRYFTYHKNSAISWLLSNSKDFRLVCKLADLDPDYAHIKFTKAIKYNISNLKQKHYIKKYPDRYRPGRYRLKF